MRGLFLSLDGVDGTGKSTQCRLLAEWLSSLGHQVTSCVDPGGTILGGQLREILLRKDHPISLEAEALLFMASRAQLVQEIIRPALTQGKVVVSDRYLLANVVYQGHAGQLNVEQLWQVGMLSTGGLLPDLTLVLDLPIEQAISRRGRPADRMESRSLDFQQRVRDGYLREAQRQPNIVVLDASGSVAAIQSQLRSHVLPILSGKG